MTDNDGSSNNSANTGGKSDPAKRPADRSSVRSVRDGVPEDYALPKVLFDEKLLDRTPRIVIKFKDDFKFDYLGDLQAQLKQKIDCGFVSTLAPNAVFKTIYRAGDWTKEYGGVREVTEALEKAAKDRDPKYKPPKFFQYVLLENLPEDAVEATLKILRSLPDVEHAYEQAIACAPAGLNPRRGLQQYLDNGTTGIGIQYAHSHGGDGVGQDFVDIEQNWMLDHEDLVTAAGAPRANLIPGPAAVVPGAEGHGTNTLGVIAATDNGVGILGIVPSLTGLNVLPCGSRTANIPQAIQLAAAFLNRLGPGGVILLEIQLFTRSSSTCWPVEIDQTIYDAIELVVKSGVIVIVPAGNGQFQNGQLVGQSLDNYQDSLGRFIFDPGIRDSGAIFVGAGERVGGAAAVPPLTWQRAPMSNFGARVNCFAWGDSVWTTDSNPGVPYTGAFGMTSAASAIVAGAALALQGMAEATGSPRLSPSDARNWLSDRAGGVNTPTASPGDSIGVMPNLENLGKGLAAKAAQQLTAKQGAGDESPDVFGEDEDLIG